MSPLVTNSSDTIIEITPEALSKLLELRDEEPEKERLGPQSSVEHIHGATLDYSDRQGLLMRNPNKPPAPVIDGLVSDDEMSAQIEAVIATDVNPSLAAHGGFVTFVGHDTDGTAYLTMGGGCHGCSMSKMTMLEGVQTTLVEQVPGVVKVRDLTDHTSGSNPFYS